MSEKRFSLKEWEDLNYYEHCFYDGESQLSDSDVVELLNEQDDELHKYRTENAELHITILENEKEIDEQQATIRKLQDLCGKSDGENAKLRIENKKLKEMNRQLKECSMK